MGVRETTKGIIAKAIISVMRIMMLRKWQASGWI